MFARRSRGLVGGIAGAAGLLAAVATTGALAASNVVAPSRLSNTLYAKTVSQFVPADCSSRITPMTIVVGTRGNSSSDLLLGGPSGTFMTGDSGNDCILGGGGDDFLRGDDGTDVCVGGPGDDSFSFDCEFRIQ